MPPRHAYWTILIDDKPTAFRAREQDELLPTFHQLQRKNTNVRMQWFARGRLWETQEAERDDFQRRRRAAAPSPDGRPSKPFAGRDDKRGGDWRPGGAHKDPRDRFKKKNRPDRMWSEGGEHARRDRDKLGPPPESRPSRDKPAGQPRGDRPWTSKPPSDRPRGDRPWTSKPPSDRPRGDRPWTSKPPSDRPRGDRPWTSKPPSDRPRGDRPWTSKPPGSAPGGDRPRSKTPADGKRPWSPKPKAGDQPWDDRPRPDVKPERRESEATMRPEDPAPPSSERIGTKPKPTKRG